MAEPLDKERRKTMAMWATQLRTASGREQNMTWLTLHKHHRDGTKILESQANAPWLLEWLSNAIEQQLDRESPVQNVGIDFTSHLAASVGELKRKVEREFTDRELLKVLLRRALTELGD